MTKVTLNRIASLVNAPTSINAALTLIEQAFERVLFRDGASPNQMTADLDMNNKRIYNLPAPGSDFEPARRIDVTGLSDYQSILAARDTAVASASTATTQAGIATTQATASAASASLAASYASSFDMRTILNASTAITTNPASNTVFFLKEWTSGGKKGGGQLIYDSSSSATVNNGTVFATPTVGRYIRPVDGVLHSNWFGIVDNTVTDQSAKFQSFINEAITNKYEAYIDPGYINCNGAQIYLNTTWAGNTARPGGGSVGTTAGGPLYGFTMRGANRRYSQIGNVLFHVGVIGAYGGDGLASGALDIGNFHINKGGLVIWSNEVASRYRDIRVMVGPACKTSFSIPSTGTPGTTYGSFTTNSGVFAYGSNQLNLDSVRTECPTTETATDYYGFWFDACTNAYMNGGGSNILGKGVVLKQAGLEFSQASQNFVSRDLHFESCIQESVFIEEGVSVRLQGHFRGSDTVTNGAWDRATYPIIRIGNSAGSASVRGVTISDSYFVGKSDLNATAIRIEKGTEVAVTQNSFTTFVNGVDIKSGGVNVSQVSRNNFASVTNDVLRDPASSYTLLPAIERVPQALTDGASINWRVSAMPNATLTLPTSATRTLLAPINPYEGLQYRLIIKKSNSSAGLTFDSAYVFSGGTAPNIAAMTTSQTCIINFYSDGTNMYGTYTIYG